jgi:EmrB/QacA subfamily drug resistance transporter
MRQKQVPYKWLIATAFVIGLFMDFMDATIVNVALPTLGRQFHAGNTTVEWVVLGYLLSLAVWIPASGWIGDRFGTKKTFMFALAVFTLGSALCGFAPTLGALIVFRIVQGVGGGMLTPVGSAMLFRAFPPAERARAATILMVPTVLAPALGPVIGGWLVTDATWRAIFYVNLPIGVFGFLFSLLFLKEHREPSAGRFDVWGFLFSGSGLALVLYALSRGPSDGWLAPNVVATGTLGVLSFAALAAVELGQAQPMLDLRLYANRMFRNANLTMYVVMGSLFSFILVLTLYLQELMGLSALESGLISLAFPLGTIAIAPVVGKRYPVIGPRRLIAFGLFGAAITSLMFVAVDLHTSLWAIRGVLFLRGLIFGMCVVPLQASAYATIKPRDMGRASSLYSTGRQVGASFSIAALITVLTTQVQTHVANAVAVVGPAGRAAAAQYGALLGFHDAFFASSLIAVLGIGLALMIRDEDAAATMQQERAITVTDVEGAPAFVEVAISGD